MLKFILRRLLEAIPTLFVLITISFFMMRLAPGSPFTGERTLSPEVMANIEAKYHLNDPIGKQYVDYLIQLAHGDFGPSFKYKDYSVNYGWSCLSGVGQTGPGCLYPGRGTGRDGRGYRRAEAKHPVGLRRHGGGNDRRGHTEFCGCPLLVLIFAITLKWLPGGGWNGGQWNYMLLPMVALSWLTLPVSRVSLVAR